MNKEGESKKSTIVYIIKTVMISRLRLLIEFIYLTVPYKWLIELVNYFM